MLIILFQCSFKHTCRSEAYVGDLTVLHRSEAIFSPDLKNMFDTLEGVMKKYRG